MKNDMTKGKRMTTKIKAKELQKYLSGVKEKRHQVLKKKISEKASETDERRNDETGNFRICWDKQKQIIAKMKEKKTKLKDPRNFR